MDSLSLERKERRWFHSRSPVLPPMWLIIPILGFVIVGMVLPGIIILQMSLGQSPSFSIGFHDLNLVTYAKFFKSSYYTQVLIKTILLSVIVGAITGVLGYPIAYFFARSSSPFQKVLFYLTLAPMAVGINILTLGWMIVLGKNGFVNFALLRLGMVSEPLGLLFSWTTLIIGLTHVSFPFMVLPIASVLRNIDPALGRAARNLGAGPIRAFLYVTFPLSIEGVAAGFLIVFMQVIGAFVMPLLLGGGKVQVLTVTIWEMLTVSFDNTYACTTASVLLGIAIVILFLQIHYFRLRS